MEPIQPPPKDATNDKKFCTLRRVIGYFSLGLLVGSLLPIIFHFIGRSAELERRALCLGNESAVDKSITMCVAEGGQPAYDFGQLISENTIAIDSLRCPSTDTPAWDSKATSRPATLEELDTYCDYVLVGGLPLDDLAGETILVYELPANHWYEGSFVVRIDSSVVFVKGVEGFRAELQKTQNTLAQLRRAKL